MKKLSYSASHDALTGLPNRASFEKQLKAAIVAGGEPSPPHSLVFLDLDRFKAVNDTAGHAAGDALLGHRPADAAPAAQQRLPRPAGRRRIRPDPVRPPAEQAKSLMQQVVNQISQHPFYWEGKISRRRQRRHHAHRRRRQSSELLAQADIACYTAKHHGRGQCICMKHGKTAAGAAA
ncbi:diguanylate cyclase [Serratia ureilytica]